MKWILISLIRLGVFPSPDMGQLCLMLLLQDLIADSSLLCLMSACHVLVCFFLHQIGAVWLCSGCPFNKRYSSCLCFRLHLLLEMREF